MRRINFYVIALVFSIVSGGAVAAQLTFDNGSFSGGSYTENGIVLTGQLQIGRLDNHDSEALTFANGINGNYELRLPSAFNAIDFDVVANPAAYGVMRLDWYLAGSGGLGLSLFVSALPRHIHFALDQNLRFERIVMNNRTAWCDADCTSSGLKFGGVVTIDNLTVGFLPVSPVPEPGAGLMLALGLVGLYCRLACIRKWRAGYVACR